MNRHDRRAKKHTTDHNMTPGELSRAERAYELFDERLTAAVAELRAELGTPQSLVAGVLFRRSLIAFADAGVDIHGLRPGIDGYLAALEEVVDDPSKPPPRPFIVLLGDVASGRPLDPSKGGIS